MRMVYTHRQGTMCEGCHDPAQHTPVIRRGDWSGTCTVCGAFARHYYHVHSPYVIKQSSAHPNLVLGYDFLTKREPLTDREREKYTEIFEFSGKIRELRDHVLRMGTITPNQRKDLEEYIKANWASARH